VKAKVFIPSAEAQAAASALKDKLLQNDQAKTK
jgi:hypothetical protein